LISALALATLFVACTEPTAPAAPTAPADTEEPVSELVNLHGSNIWRYEYLYRPHGNFLTKAKTTIRGEYLKDQKMTFISRISSLTKVIRTIRGEYLKDQKMTVITRIDSGVTIDSFYDQVTHEKVVMITQIADTSSTTRNGTVYPDSVMVYNNVLPVFFPGGSGGGMSSTYITYKGQDYPCALNNVANWSYWVGGIGMVFYCWAHYESISIKLLSFNGSEVTLVAWPYDGNSALYYPNL
jgi:uncharacterized protein YnzC (UPF0291/DUF896 family)